jgi:pectin methylesterase-like acyl-CoA thioesterase
MKRLLTLIAMAMLAPVALAATRSVPSQYSTVQAAINAAASGDTIAIANGTYTGVLVIPIAKTGLKIVGASQTGVILQSGANSTTLTVHAADTTISYLTILNTYREGSTTNHALEIDAKRVELYRCYINGMQDTMAIWEAGLVYCAYCEIRGSVDFIYGGGPAFFHSCNIKQERSTGGVNTAPRHPANYPYGFVFSGCKINKASSVGTNNSTLMRPWGASGATAYINCTMDNHITAAGWAAWGGREATCRAAEYGSKTLAGATINLSTRSSWVKRLTAAEASAYSRNNVLGGWVPPL